MMVRKMKHVVVEESTARLIQELKKEYSEAELRKYLKSLKWSRGLFHF